MKRKIIKKSFKILSLCFLLLSLVGIGCGKGGSLSSAPSNRKVASEIDNSKNGVPNGEDGTGGSNGVPGGSDGTGGSSGVPGGSDGENNPNGVPGGSDGENDPNGVPGGSDGGNSSETHTFSITQTAREQKEVDILMVIDNSGSMNDNHTNLGQRFGNLFNSNLQRVDWQMAFISSAFGVGVGWPKIFYNLLNNNMGLVGNKILSPQLGNPGDVFLNTISSRQGGGHSITEFEGILNMINSPETHPEGFFRENALLAIVVVTDDTDTTNVRASDIITAVKNNFGEFKQFAAYGLIVEPGDVECNGREPNVNYKVADLAEKTGGITGSICATDYSSIMADIGTHIEEILVYHEVMLRHTNVVEDSITLNCSLSQNTVECSNWEFDSESNKILFDTPPEEGVKVQISYNYQP